MVLIVDICDNEFFRLHFCGFDVLCFLYFSPLFFLVDIDAKTINSQNQTGAFLVCYVIIRDPIRLQVLGHLVNKIMIEVMFK